MMPDNVAALAIMFCVGYAGALALVDRERKRWVTVAGAIWITVWCLPPLAALWIKGVFG